MPGGVRLVVCVNRRLGTGQRSCAGSGSLALIARIEQMIEAEKLDVPIVRRECLGRCEAGPVMRIAPGGRFFTLVDESSISDMIRELKRFAAEIHGPRN